MSADRLPGVADSIELRNGLQVIQASDDQVPLGEAIQQAPEYEYQCKKRCSNGCVASDGDRYAAMVSYEVG